MNGGLGNIHEPVIGTVFNFARGHVRSPDSIPVRELRSGTEEPDDSPHPYF